MNLKHAVYRLSPFINYWIISGSMHRKTRIPTFIKASLKNSDDKANIDKYRLAANITEYQNISKLNFWRIFMMIRQLFHVKNVCNNVINQHG